MKPVKEPHSQSKHNAHKKGASMEYIQIGITARRAPDGTFLPSTPIYAEVTDANRQEFIEGEKKMISEISVIFAEKYRQYLKEVRKATRLIGAKQ